MSTIAAIATPAGAGGIGVIRVSGPQAIAVADRVFFAYSKKKLSQIPGYTALYGKVLAGDEMLDEVVALLFRAPKSYTGEDVVELSCHGGSYVLSRVLRLLFAEGCAPAEPGEFTRRAFLNGKMDVTRAEAVMKLISARGNDALQAAVHTLSGTLKDQTDEICDLLVTASASLGVWADYPEEDVPSVQGEDLSASLTRAETLLSALLSRFDSGQAVSEGVNTVICGKPNVGKSALMNLLTGRERSIVTEVAGTTRDVIEETVLLGNVLLRLSDTAGIHETGDTVERIGVSRALERLTNASLIYAVFDSSRPLDEEDRELIERCWGKRCIAVLNKSDLPAKTTAGELSTFFENIVEISAQNGEGYEELQQKTEALLGTDGIDTAAPMLMNERQYRCCASALQDVREAIDALHMGLTFDAVHISIDSAIDHLLELTGQKVSDTVVDKIFASFCVGK